MQRSQPFRRLAFGLQIREKEWSSLFGYFVCEFGGW